MIFSVKWEQEANLLNAIDAFEDALLQVGALSTTPPEPSAFFDFFNDAQQLTVDKTAITAGMLKLLFDLGYAAGPELIVGIGTYQGLPLSALVAGARRRSDKCSALGVDIDPQANLVARRNANHLGLGRHLHFLDRDGVAFLRESREPIDLLYLDLDDLHNGKRGYVECFREAAPLLRRHALVLAHDAISPSFVQDLEDLRKVIVCDGRFNVLIDIPVDSAGLFLASKDNHEKKGEK